MQKRLFFEELFLLLLLLSIFFSFIQIYLEFSFPLTSAEICCHSKSFLADSNFCGCYYTMTFIFKAWRFADKVFFINTRKNSGVSVQCHRSTVLDNFWMNLAHFLPLQIILLNIMNVTQYGLPQLSRSHYAAYFSFPHTPTLLPVSLG